MSRAVALALVCLGAVAAAAPDAYKEAMARGAALLDKKDARGAMKAYEDALAARPDDPRAANELSWAAIVAGDFAAAKEAAEKALDAGRYDLTLQPLARYNLGRALEGLGDKEGARAAYRRSLALRENKEVRSRFQKLGGPALFTGEPLEGPFDDPEAWCKRRPGKPSEMCDVIDEPTGDHPGKPFGEVKRVKTDPYADFDSYSADVALAVGDAWWVMPFVGLAENRVGFSIEHAKLVEGRLWIEWQQDAGRFTWDMRRGILVCGLGAKKRPSCVGPIVLEAVHNEHSGGKEDGTDTESTLVHCTARLLPGDLLEVACEGSAGSGKHKLTF